MGVLGRALVVGAVLSGCGATGPEGAATDVDGVLTQVCRLAAQCPGVSATAAEVEACPAEIRAQLGPAQLDELERVTTYPDARQTCVMACLGERICGRFGGSVLNISDSDVLEPLADCRLECPAAAMGSAPGWSCRPDSLR